jgi:ABC-2 type transport system permease protein
MNSTDPITNANTMTRTLYVRYEVVRNFRNLRFFFLALAFPLVLYFIIGSADRHVRFDGTAFPLYFMVAMATLGTMAGVLSSAAIIAAERSSGWTRQMRITPLSTGAYFAAKVLNAYLRALLTIALMCLAGTALGVRLSAVEWLTVIGLLLVGLVPFTVLGILLGHLIGPDSSPLAVGGLVTLFSLLGGVYGFQVATSGPLFQFIKALPSYWLVQAGKTALGHGDWPAEGWIVIAAWTIVLTIIAVLVYKRAGSQTA